MRTIGLSTADDAVIWDHALRHGFTIVSKDSDFSGLSSLFGAPPKVIWLTLGNCSTAVVERCPRLVPFSSDQQTWCRLRAWHAQDPYKRPRGVQRRIDVRQVSFLALILRSQRSFRYGQVRPPHS